MARPNAMIALKMPEGMVFGKVRKVSVSRILFEIGQLKSFGSHWKAMSACGRPLLGASSLNFLRDKNFTIFNNTMMFAAIFIEFSAICWL